MNEVKIGRVKLSAEDVEQIYYCLSMRIGYLETGTPHRAKDLEKADKDFKPHVLSTDQMRLIIRLDEIMLMLVE